MCDPPRAGLHKSVLRALLDCAKIRRLVFVSCNPDNLISNVALLCVPPRESGGGEAVQAVAWGAWSVGAGAGGCCGGRGQQRGCGRDGGCTALECGPPVAAALQPAGRCHRACAVGPHCSSGTPCQLPNPFPRPLCPLAPAEDVDGGRGRRGGDTAGSSGASYRSQYGGGGGGAKPDYFANGSWVPFRPVKATALDLFPHTAHVETVMLLER